MARDFFGRTSRYASSLWSRSSSNGPDPTSELPREDLGDRVDGDVHSSFPGHDDGTPSARVPLIPPTHDDGGPPTANGPPGPPADASDPDDERVRAGPSGRRWTVVATDGPTSVEGWDASSRWARLRRHHRLERALDAVRHDVATASTDFVIVHGGPEPDAARVEELIDAVELPVDRGGGTMGEGHNIARQVEVPDICLADDGSDVVVSRAWQRWVRDGAHAVTVGHPEPAAGATLVVRSAAIAERRPPAPAPAWQRTSWWISAVVVAWFAAVQIARILTGTTSSAIAALRGGAPPAELSDQDLQWIDAIDAGTVDVVGGAPLPGSSLWPAIARPLYTTFGVAGVQWLSLIFTVVAISTSAAAASRLFGRWAARSTAVLLSLALAATGAATTVGPTALAMAALGVALLAIGLVEHHDRRSWILLAGLASTVAVIAAYQTIVFVGILSLFFTLLRGRHGLTDSNTFRLVLAAGALAWFLPTREASTRFILDPRWRVDWRELVSDTLALAVLVVVVSLLVTAGGTDVMIRRRVMVLSTSLLATPFAHLISGATLATGTDISITLVLVTPAVGGAIAFRLAQFRHGPAAPAPRGEPELLVVDPRTGRVRRRLVKYANRQVRIAAGCVVASALWYLPWAMMNIDWRNWWIAVPFLLANGCMVGTALLSGFNNWNRAVPIPVDVARGHEPLVGVIVPTYSEPLHMVLNTVRSVFDQDWPAERLRVVVSDDAHSDEMRDAVAALGARLPDGALLYNRPPKKGDPARRGDSKAGNLNSAVLLVDDCDFVETRDADDLVGSSNFLRHTIAQLMDDPGVGFIQTIKETKTSVGDPFNNNEPFFYRGTMLARNADYAIFPCGSGLVWRRRALADIDDFPGWNLVEDLHSGVLGLRAGWRGLYVPIVGTYAQHSPEDVANVFKQRGTWALDTTRLLVFDRFRNIPRKMRLHFLEQAIFYLLSFPLLVLVVVPALGLFFDRFPLETDPTTYAIHFWGFALSIELMLLSLAAAQAPGSLWRSRLSWIGMAPVYAKAAIRALWYGKNKKPAYKVTRKTDDYQWYVRLVKVHWLLFVATVVAMIVALVRDDFLTKLDLGSMYWGIVALVGLGAFLRLSWFGVDPREKLRLRWERTVERWHRLRLRLGIHTREERIERRLAAGPKRRRPAAAPTPVAPVDVPVPEVAGPDVAAPERDATVPVLRPALAREDGFESDESAITIWERFRDAHREAAAEAERWLDQMLAGASR